MALSIASVPILTGNAADRFDELLQKTEENRGTIDFTQQIQESRKILRKAKLM